MDFLVRARGGSPCVSAAVAMSELHRDHFHRTAKIVADQGIVCDVADARPHLENFLLQIHVGPRIDVDLAAQAALLTALNTGRRAMLGGVAVLTEDDPRLLLPWARNERLREAVVRHGGTLVSEFIQDAPALRIGHPRQSTAADLQITTWVDGWSGGVTNNAGRSSESGMPLAGVVAGALGVSEIFQHMIGSPTAARRGAGVSLWRPDLSWQEPEAAGPTLQYLPSRVWLLALGHLGQANAWSIGCLPYSQPSGLETYLIDYDTIVEANHATGLLTCEDDLGQLKSRVVADKLEQLGHNTRLVERAFDDHLNPRADEPTVALAGFHSVTPRRVLGGKFRRVVDGGLGSGPRTCFDILLHTFPSRITPEEAFPDLPHSSSVPPAAYTPEVDRRIRGGADPEAARCGILELAGATPAAAFVGATAAALMVSDLLRFLHGGEQYEALAFNLRSTHVTAYASETPQPFFNPGYVGVDA